MTQDAPLDQTQQAVWDIIEQRIDAAPTDGIAADGQWNVHVKWQQKGFVDGMRAARLAAINALSRRVPASGGEAEPPAVALLRGPLSKRATSAEFNEWQAREIVAYIDAIAAFPIVAAPEGLSYGRIIEIVNDCTERMKRGGESHRMLARWISEGIHAALAAAPSIPEGKAEPVAYRFVPKEQTTVEDHIWRFAAMHPGDQWRVEPLFVAQVQHE